MYLELLRTMSVYDDCGVVGTPMANPFVAVPSGGLKTDEPVHLTRGEVMQGPWAGMQFSDAFRKFWTSGLLQDFPGDRTFKSLNVAELECPTAGVGSTVVGSLTYTTIGPPWLPYIVPPLEISTLQPIWSSLCADRFPMNRIGVFDPPHALVAAPSRLVPSEMAQNMADPTPHVPSPAKTQKAQAGLKLIAPVPTPTPRVKDTVNSHEKDNSPDPADPKSDDMSSDSPKANKGSNYHHKPGGYAGATSDKSPKENKQSDHLQKLGANSAANSDPGNQDPRIDFKDTDESETPVSGAMSDESPKQNKQFDHHHRPGDHPSTNVDPDIEDPKANLKGTNDGEPPASGATGENLPQQNKQSDHLNNAGGNYGTSKNLQNQDPKVDLEVAHDHEIAADGVANTVGGQTFTPDVVKFSTGGTIVKPGQPATTVDHTSTSLEASGVPLTDSKTLSLASSEKAMPTPIAMTIGQQKITPEPTGLVVAGKIVSPGGAAVNIGGTRVSLGLSGQLVVGTRTTSLTAESFSVPHASQTGAGAEHEAKGQEGTGNATDFTASVQPFTGGSSRLSAPSGMIPFVLLFCSFDFL